MLLAVASGTPAAELAWTDVAVRVYHDGAVSEADETRALTTAASILAPANVALRWAHCHASIPLDVECGRPLGPGEQALRLTRTRYLAANTRVLALGEALLNSRGAAPALATVYLDRVDWLAQRSRADGMVLLGRAIAHELTHLLTGDGRHAQVGLMRPVWSAGELLRGHPADWMLDAKHVAAIRARAAATMTLAGLEALGP